MIPPAEALTRLKDGNRRFVAERAERHGLADASRRKEVVDGQHPMAIVLGCSDSRVPAEIVFDQGLGDLFVIRVAGNIVAPSQIGSVEFAAEVFGTRLVVVLGHSRCGAVKATLDQLREPADHRSPNLRSIVERIYPAVEPLLESKETANPEHLLTAAVRVNVEASVRQLQQGSAILEGLVRDDGLLILGAEYSLETGVVDFFEDA